MFQYSSIGIIEAEHCILLPGWADTYLNYLGRKENDGTEQEMVGNGSTCYTADIIYTL